MFYSDVYIFYGRNYTKNAHCTHNVRIYARTPTYANEVWMMIKWFCFERLKSLTLQSETLHASLTLFISSVWSYYWNILPYFSTKERSLFHTWLDFGLLRDSTLNRICHPFIFDTKNVHSLTCHHFSNITIPFRFFWMCKLWHFTGFYALLITFNFITSSEWY